MRTYHPRPEQFAMTDLTALAQERPGIALSIYMPTNDQRGHRLAQEPLLLRQLTDDAAQQLADLGWRPGAIAAFLAPIYALAVPDQSFWPYQQHGLAIFRSQDFFTLYQLPEPTIAQTRIGTHFWLRPLVSATSADGDFYLLTLSQNKVQLYHGSRGELFPIAVPNLPTALAETLRYDQFERTLQYHSTSSSGGATAGRRAAIFHGQGDAGDERIKHQQLARFLQEVAAAIHTQLAEQQAPLFLAGVDYIKNIYREHNRYPHLRIADLTGNMDHLTAIELHRAILPLFSDYQRELSQSALARYVELTPLTRTVDNIETVVHAAQFQRIDSLFVAPLALAADAPPSAAEHWGAVDPITGYITRHSTREPDDEEFVDFAMLQVLRHGGAIYTIPATEMPSETMAAILRY